MLTRNDYEKESHEEKISFLKNRILMAQSSGEECKKLALPLLWSSFSDHIQTEPEADF